MGTGGTAEWKCCGLFQNTTLCFCFEVANEVSFLGFSDRKRSDKLAVIVHYVLLEGARTVYRSFRNTRAHENCVNSRSRKFGVVPLCQLRPARYRIIQLRCAIIRLDRYFLYSFMFSSCVTTFHMDFPQ